MEPRMDITFLMQMLSQSVLSWMGESDQFGSAKFWATGILAMENDWFDVTMFVRTSETIKLT